MYITKIGETCLFPQFLSLIHINFICFKDTVLILSISMSSQQKVAWIVKSEDNALGFLFR